jgi:predicted transcriptional regulator
VSFENEEAGRPEKVVDDDRLKVRFFQTKADPRQTVRELAEELGEDKSTISRHLSGSASS